MRRRRKAYVSFDQHSDPDSAMTAGGGTAYRLAALLLAFPSHMYLPERESQTGLAHKLDFEVFEKLCFKIVRKTC